MSKEQITHEVLSLKKQMSFMKLKIEELESEVKHLQNDPDDLAESDEICNHSAYTGRLHHGGKYAGQ